MNDQPTVKGFFIQQAIKYHLDRGVSQKIIDQAVEEVGLKTISSYKEYPVELEIQLQEKLLPHIFEGKERDEAFRLYGRESWRSFSTSLLGRTFISVLGNDPLQIVKVASKMMGATVKGVQVTTHQLESRKFSICLTNNPYPAPEFQGALEAAIEDMGHKPSVQITKDGGNVTEFTISWN